MRKIKLIFMALLFIGILAGCNLGPDPVVEILGVADVTISVGDEFNLMDGITATEDGDDITSSIVIVVTDENNVVVVFNTADDFVYYVTYTVLSSGTSEERIITVEGIDDITAPVITGVESFTLESNVPYNPLEGLSAIDDIDGDVTSDVVVTYTLEDGTAIIDPTFIDPEIIKVIYTVSDSSGNEAILEIEVNIVDLEPPVITGGDVQVSYNDLSTIYDGFTAYDNIDGDLTDALECLVIDEFDDEIVDLEGLLGEFTINCSVFDSSANEIVGVYILTIVDDIAPVITAEDQTFNNDQLVDPVAFATAMDEFDGDVTFDLTYVIKGPDGVFITEIEDVAGGYTVTYTVSDSEGNEATKEITIILLDVIAPVLTQTEFYMYIEDASVFNVFDYILAIDETDGDITLDVLIVTEFGPDYFEGRGTVLYIITSTDSAGNTSGSIALNLNFEGGPIVFSGINVVTAEAFLITYYMDIFDNGLTTAEVCAKYIGDVPFDMMITYEECLIGLEEVKAIVTGYSVDSVVLKMVGDDTHYVATVTLNTIMGDSTFGVEFNIMGYAYREGEYLNFVTDPFQFGPNPIEVTIVEAEAALFEYYNNLIDDSYDITLFCNTYVMDMVNNEATLEECVAGVTGIRGYLDEFNIDSVVEVVITPPEGDPFDGFMATITLATMDGTAPVEIYFAFFEVNGEPYLTLFGSPLGEDGGGGEFADLTTVEAIILIDQFYDDLMDELITSTDFCLMYGILGEDMQPVDTSTCIAWRDVVLSESYDFTTGSIDFIAGQDGGPPVFIVEVEDTSNMDPAFQVMFIFMVGPEDTIYTLTIGDVAIGVTELVMGGGDGPAIATIDLATAEAMINQFYLDAVDGTMTDAEFCAKYFTLASTMEPLVELDCTNLRAAAVVDGFTFTATNVEYFEGQNGGPPYYRATVTATDGYLTKEYNVMFLFIVGPDSNPMLATQLAMSLGVEFALEMAPIDEAFAQTMIEDFYSDLFNEAIDNTTFCNTWIENSPLYVGTTQDCIDGRNFALSRNEEYSVGMVTIYENYPLHIYQVTITVTEGVEVFQYTMHFFITTDGTNFYLTLMTEIIVDVPPGPM